MLLLLQGYGVANSNVGIIRTWNLRPRDMSFSLADRDTAWSLRPRDTDMSLDNRDTAWSLRPRDKTWSIDER